MRVTGVPWEGPQGLSQWGWRLLTEAETPTQAELCSQKIHVFESSSPGPVSVALHGARVLLDGQVKMKSLDQPQSTVTVRL